MTPVRRAVGEVALGCPTCPVEVEKKGHVIAHKERTEGGPLHPSESVEFCSNQHAYLVVLGPEGDA